ncbi:MAG: universal stress protein [Armatimonadetes bacterium]|nr:universal stress protein [Armatimonadota bacterium]
MYKKILFSTDGSESALAAGISASELASLFHSEVILLYVAPGPERAVMDGFGAGLGIPDTARGDVPRLVEDAVTAILERSRKPFDNRDVKVTQRHIVGDPAEVICRTARDEKVDLIVLGSRGLGKVAQFFLGSVSREVAQKASCSVLVVK